ncbi:MAG TPA: rhamnulokinase family protein [Dongiaceae bacterium]|nr:rhamnulokinase family protein [Dongiaceae bacterium]
MNTGASSRVAQRRHVIAVDLGAESCRISLITAKGSETTIEVVHRFPNAPTEVDGHLHWPLAHICSQIEAGLGFCAERARAPIDSIGVDGWAVDYVWLDGSGRPLRDPFCYRDLRTEARQIELWKKLPPERIHELTGIQMLRFNTLYQLFADACDGQAMGSVWLNLPEYILHRLGGSRAAEFTNATHTQMVKVGTMKWSEEVVRTTGLDSSSFPPIVPPGTILGNLQEHLAELPGFRNTELIAPACHDTGSAIAGIPATGDEWAFISSGTWSLVGTVLPRACLSEAAYRGNFSNEGGLGGTSRFLRNVNGMWLIEECLREWRRKRADWKLPDLITESRRLSPPQFYIPVDEPDLLLPGNMPGRINAVLEKHGLNRVSEEPAEAPTLAGLIFHSLAKKYAQLLRNIAEITGKRFSKIHIVGGGSQNGFLNELVESYCGLPVVAGPVECSTIGNAAIQLAVLEGEVEAPWGVRPEAVARWARCLSQPKLASHQ